MRKIDINLYPYAIVRENTIVKTMDTFLPVVFLVLCVCIVLNLGLLGFRGYLGARKRVLSQRWKEVSAPMQALTALQQEVASIRGKQQEFQDVLIGILPSAQVLADVYASVPETIWFSEIKATPKTLSCTGYAVKWNGEYMRAIDGMLKNFRQSPSGKALSDIALKNTRKATIGGTEVMKFEFECKNPT